MDHFDLGSHGRPISTASAETQRWFDIGLNWCYGFNHEDAIKCFERALETDATCPMVHWGIAYAAGPFYNLTWKEHGAVEATVATRRCFEHVGIARAHAVRASETERRLIGALSCRFQHPHPASPAEFSRWDDAYAAEMRRVYHRLPDDPDVMARFVESLMMRTVRKLWDLRTGEPAANSDALEALAVCQRAIAMADDAGRPQHPSILHLHIHLLEMSAMPECAMRSTDLLGNMCPDAGHMNHMPGHIYVLCGEYEKAQWASEKAIRANDLYLGYADTPTYYLLGCGHDLHLMMYACMFLGQMRTALWAADEVRRLITHEIVTLADRPKLSVGFPHGSMRRLPPLNALRVFEVAARTGSYAAAGAELGLTHGAVSRQIAALENWLGQRLFVRTGRRMAATQAARAFAAEVSLSFDRVLSAADAFGRLEARRIPRVSAPTTFAMRWLIPRLDRFHAERPVVEVAVTTATTLHDELRGGFDVAIRRGSAEQEAWPQHRAVAFLEEADTLIVSLALFERRPLRRPDDIASHVLLTTETRPGDWTDWLDRAGLLQVAGHRRRVFDHFFVTLQAVVDGLGLGIGPLPVPQGDLTSGRILAPFPTIAVSRRGYVALVLFEADKTSSLTGFIECLRIEGTA